MEMSGHSTPSWPRPAAGSASRIWLGADYNPEQWDREVWDEDIRLMRRAGVTIVSLGIFSWGALQPEPERWTFEWLDEAMDRLAGAGISVDLATATATPPIWLTQLHPEVLPIEADGTEIGPGARIHWRPTSPVFRRYALELCRRMARRYAGHPALVAWHAANEYGWNNRLDYSPDAERAFQQWCRARFGTIEALNDAWGTSFWSHQVSDFDQIEVPRYSGPSLNQNPAHVLDFKRFSSDALRDFFRAERQILREETPDIPVTTNFMVSMGQSAMAYDQWAEDVDFLSNDHYFTAGDLHIDELAFSGSLMAGLGEHRRPWYLMEQSTSAVNWHRYNHRLKGQEMIRDSVLQVATGADAISFFQWRQSRFGAERHHSAIIPHAGSRSAVFDNVCRLGEVLGDLSEVAGADPDPAPAAVVFDYQSEWALEDDTLPNNDADHWSQALAWYSALLDNGLRADVVPLSRDWQRYELVVLPAVYLLSEADAQRVRSYIDDGGTVIVTCVTGLADEFDRIWLGGYPGSLRDHLGVRVEEFEALGAGPDCPGAPETVPVDNGTTARQWADVVTSVAPSATVLHRYAQDAGSGLAGMPAMVRNRHGAGTAVYLGCRMDAADLATCLPEMLEGLPIAEHLSAADGPILTLTRTGGGRTFTFRILRGPGDARVTWTGTVLAAGGLRTEAQGSGVLSEGGFLVTREPATSRPAQ